MNINKLDKNTTRGFWSTDFPLFFVKINEIISNLNRLFDSKKPVTLEDGALITWNYQDGYNSKVVLEGDRTLSITNLEPGDYGTIEFIQDDIGTRTITLPANSIVMGTQGTATMTLSTAADAIDIASFYYNGTTISWNLSKY